MVSQKSEKYMNYEGTYQKMSPITNTNAGEENDCQMTTMYILKNFICWDIAAR